MLTGVRGTNPAISKTPPIPIRKMPVIVDLSIACTPSTPPPSLPDSPLYDSQMSSPETSPLRTARKMSLLFKKQSPELSPPQANNASPIPSPVRTFVLAKPPAKPETEEKQDSPSSLLGSEKAGGVLKELNAREPVTRDAAFDALLDVFETWLKTDQSKKTPELARNVTLLSIQADRLSEHLGLPG